MALGEEYRKEDVEAAIDEKRDVELGGITDKVISVTTPASADAEFTVEHGVDNTPFYFLVLSRDKSASVYRGAKAWTRTQAYLKCSAASVALKLIFFRI